ncbi:hypothetical protein LPN01_07460 [Sphingomonas sp. A2-49]|uniref:hypothetical protein n=1 Tax=Sphingomonas sp. A2-49 TaxID=1391375 RepID=UPI0021CE9B3D|nr:hypothetical protein [Sphingomonas sp. A2-49]MCU6453911.1 hypothetical protein [Sphingomonas sp. A2-49]
MRRILASGSSPRIAAVHTISHTPPLPIPKPSPPIAPPMPPVPGGPAVAHAATMVQPPASTGGR